MREATRSFTEGVLPVSIRLEDGPDGNRTHNLLCAKQALFSLSYGGPKEMATSVGGAKCRLTPTRGDKRVMYSFPAFAIEDSGDDESAGTPALPIELPLRIERSGFEPETWWWKAM